MMYNYKLVYKVVVWVFLDKFMKRKGSFKKYNTFNCVWHVYFKMHIESYFWNKSDNLSTQLINTRR